jgi:AcrR family transcriptional regulator
MTKTDGASKRRSEGADETPARQRILDAALAAFTEAGFAEASTLEIATRARVSKRELYALVGNKKDILVACIGARAERLKAPIDLPVPSDRVALAHALSAFGAQLLREISDPTVVAVFRLAIAEAVRAPEIARTLDSIGRAASRDALIETMANARSHGFVHGDPAEMAERFGALLWGNLMVSLLLGVAERPSPREVVRRASNAAAAFLKLYPQPEEPAIASRPPSGC